MQQLNRFYKRSKISERKFRQLLRYFALDLTASHAAQLTTLSRRSVTSIFLKIRERIAEECQRASPFAACEVEVDESYFGARRVRGKRGRCASGKTIVFGIFKRNGCVYTEVVPDCKKATLQAIIRGRVSLNAIINSDGWRGYDGLVDVGYSKHFRVNHGEDEFVRGLHHVNGIESFLSYSKCRLQKFNGVSNRTFYLHLKECEYRFNNRNKDLGHLLLKLLEKHPL
ncbi:MAG TPA: IS1595 family transposase [Pyrinomonadaceae bacterium]|jgi:transposase-like protein|nr:IS1595 family transposase [Pyrinomonadaceae bacterium]